MEFYSIILNKPYKPSIEKPYKVKINNTIRKHKKDGP